MLNRKQRIEHYRKNPDVSVLIVGAGINGIGVFWDLALQGVDVLMVDRGDYCSGASAASSHMVHGGIRYLENGEFRLVREAVQERNWLIEKAPYLVKPLPTAYPIFKWFSGILNAPLKFLGLLDRPAERGAIVIKLGMMLYDFYTSGKHTVPRHRFMNKKESPNQFPALNRQVLFTGTYYDAAMVSPERIAIELVKDAVDFNKQAIPLNYLSIDSIQDHKVILRDEISGDAFSVVPKIVVNAADPWIDIVNRKLSHPTNFIGGTKGSHLVLDHPELRRAIGEYEIFFENIDGRIVLVFPLEDKVLVGTSDIYIDNPDDAVVTEQEIEYFFEMLKRVFPKITIDKSHIVFTFSGVRPLARSDSNRTGQITWDHKINKTISEGFPIYSLVGGKWTTFRAFSEQASENILAELKLPRQVSTKGIAFGGAKNYPRTLESKKEWITKLAYRTNVSPIRIETLFSRYSTLAEDVTTFITQNGDRPLINYPTYSTSEIGYIVFQEDVVHLDDFLLRRSMIGMLGKSTSDGLNELALVIGNALSWDKDAVQYETHRTVDLLKSKHLIDSKQYLGDLHK